MLWTAVASAIAHIAMGPANAVQLGASGIVFMLILLNSLVEAKLGRIPLTFVCQVVIWCYKEVYAHLFAHDGVSHLAHLSGAFVGTVAGYYMHEQNVMDRVKKIGLQWRSKVK